MDYPAVVQLADKGSARMLAYTAAVTPLQEQLKRALIQFSGFALIALTRPKAGVAEFDLIEAALASLAAAEDGLRGVEVPHGAAHGHRHFLSAIHFLALCRQAALATPRSLEDPFYNALDEAQRHFAAACRATPGLAPVDLSQACCAPAARQHTVAINPNHEDETRGKIFHLGA